MIKLTLAQKVAKTVSRGLSRSAITTCGKWAEKYRVMGTPFPGPWDWPHHPWLLEMHDPGCEEIVGEKAAQMGYTECAINTAFFHMDVKSLDVLYILPTTSDASTFSSGRFDPALAMSPYLKDFFADVNNVSLKRAATSTLYVRGSHSKAKLKSVPTAVVIFDELEEMPDYTVPLAIERQSGQVYTFTFKLSTPTTANRGIDLDYNNSTAEQYHFRCSHCGRLTFFDWDSCLVVVGENVTDPRVKESYIQCKECKAKIDFDEKPALLQHRDKGGTAFFVSQYQQRSVRGFHVSQLYSMAKVGRPENLAIAELKAKTDPTYAQELHNSKKGKPYTAPGAKINDDQIQKCMSSFARGDIDKDHVRTMGIDVGAVLHLVVKEWYQRCPKTPDLTLNDCFDCRVILDKTTSGSMNDFDEAAQLFTQLRCRAGVCDGEPERRAAQQFAMRFRGLVLLCDYLYSQRGRSVTVDESEGVIKVNRTSWLDLSLGRFRNQTTLLPYNVSSVYRDQIKSLTRVMRVDKHGGDYAIYVNDGPDHFAHADCYADIALPFAMGIGQTTDIQGMY